MWLYTECDCIQSDSEWVRLYWCSVSDCTAQTTNYSACALFVLLRFLIFYSVTIFSQAYYLKIYWTDLCQIFRLGGTKTVDDQSPISLSIRQGTFPWQPKDVDMAATFHMSGGNLAGENCRLLTSSLGLRLLLLGCYGFI